MLPGLGRIHWDGQHGCEKDAATRTPCMPMSRASVVSEVYVARPSCLKSMSRVRRVYVSARPSCLKSMSRVRRVRRVRRV